MSRTDTFAPGAPIWFDLFSSDVAASRAFYGELFGWQTDEPNEEFGGYVNARIDGDAIAGMMSNHGEPGSPDVWSIYLAVEDCQASTEAALRAGAQVIAPVAAVGDLGTMAVIVDPSGAVVGFWQPGTHPGFERRDEPGAPSWFELHTRNFVAATEFYQAVLGWQLNAVADAPEFRYSTVEAGGNEVAGVYDAANDLPEGMPSYWVVYLDVADADASAARATELGATVIEGPVDTPYGRIATIQDPTGAVFKIRQLDAPA